MRDHTPQTTDSWLDNGQFSSIQKRAKALQSLNQAVNKYVKNAENCRVANYRQGVLIIEVSSAAWSMRLNYDRMHLLNQLRQTVLPQLVNIEIKVNPELAKSEAPVQTKKIKPRRQMSEKMAGEIREKAQSLPDKLRVRMERIAAQAEKKNK